MGYITLNELKEHLRVEFNDDNAYLTTLINVAECAVANEMERELSDVAVGGVLPPALKHAIMVLCGDLYNNRESVAFSTPAEVPLSFKYLLAPYKRYNKGCSGVVDPEINIDIQIPENNMNHDIEQEEPSQTEQPSDEHPVPGMSNHGSDIDGGAS